MASSIASEAKGEGDNLPTLAHHNNRESQVLEVSDLLETGTSHLELGTFIFFPSRDINAALTALFYQHKSSNT
jgi:hypothetical protein